MPKNLRKRVSGAFWRVSRLLSACQLTEKMGNKSIDLAVKMHYVSNETSNVNVITVPRGR